MNIGPDFTGMVYAQKKAVYAQKNIPDIPLSSFHMKLAKNILELYLYFRNIVCESTRKPFYFAFFHVLCMRRLCV